MAWSLFLGPSQVDAQRYAMYNVFMAIPSVGAVQWVLLAELFHSMLW